MPPGAGLHHEGPSLSLSLPPSHSPPRLSARQPDARTSCSQDEADRRGRELLDSGKRYWDPKNGKYASHKDRFFEEVQNFFTSYADDGLNQRLGESVKTLVTDLFLNSEGNPTYKPHLWRDIRSVILPALFSQIGYVPVPRAEYTSKDVDLVIENLTLETANILPNIFEIEVRLPPSLPLSLSPSLVAVLLEHAADASNVPQQARNYFRLSPYDNLGDVSKHAFWVSFEQVQLDLKDVAFCASLVSLITPFVDVAVVVECAKSRRAKR